MRSRGRLQGTRRQAGTLAPRRLGAGVASVLVAAALTAASGGTARAAATPSHGERMLLPGRFFREDVAAATAGDWQALCPTPRGIAIVTTPVEIRAIPSPLPDEDEADGDDGGRSVAAKRCPDALALLRVPGLADGPVVTTAAGRLPLARDGVARLFVSNPNASSHLSATQKPGSATAEVILSRGEARQTLATITDCCNDNWPALVWAGDLDRDGALDLLLDVSGHYASSELVLFLSSAARPGELAGEVARLALSSC